MTTTVAKGNSCFTELLSLSCLFAVILVINHFLNIQQLLTFYYLEILDSGGARATDCGDPGFITSEVWSIGRRFRSISFCDDFSNGMSIIYPLKKQWQIIDHINC